MTIENTRAAISTPKGLDFGYSWVWTYGYLVLTAPLAAAAAVVWLIGWPAWVAFMLLVPATWGFASFLLMRFRSGFNVLPALPTPDYLPSVEGDVLDLGCGLGRATIMVALARPGLRVTAIDKFDATYIDSRGGTGLTRNLELAGVADRVTAREGDLLDLPFADQTFDGLVSSFAIDHTADVARALAEANRVLRPGGQFLLLVSLPSIVRAIPYLPLFVISRRFASAWRGMRSPDGWRADLESAGFTVDAVGSLRNAGWFLASRPTEGRHDRGRSP